LAVRSLSLKQKKSDLVSKHGGATTNTGKVEVQVSLLTDRIQGLTEHLKAHKKDFSTQRGLLKLVGQRRKLLDYMKNSEPGRYLKLLSALDLRK